MRKAVMQEGESKEVSQVTEAETLHNFSVTRLN